MQAVGAACSGAGIFQQSATLNSRREQHWIARKRSCAIVCSSSAPKSEGFSGRDFLKEFDELFKKKPADKDPPKLGGSGTGLSGLFTQADRSGLFSGSSIGGEKPKGEKMKKAGKKFFSSNPAKLEVKEIVEAFKINEADVGSSPVQIALLSQRIKYVGAHLTEHPKDFSSKRGLKAMVEQRKKHLLYLRKKDMPMYLATIAKLGLRDNVIKTIVKRGRASV